MKLRPSWLLPALRRSSRRLASGLRACPGKIVELSQADFRSPAPIADVVHQAVHQADSSSMLARVDAGIGGRGGSYVKTWTGVLDYDRESRWIDLYPAANCLGAVVLATVECGIGQHCNSTNNPSPAASSARTPLGLSVRQSSVRDVAMQRKVSASSPSTMRPEQRSVTFGCTAWISILNMIPS